MKRRPCASPRLSHDVIWLASQKRHYVSRISLMQLQHVAPPTRAERHTREGMSPRSIGMARLPTDVCRTAHPCRATCPTEYVAPDRRQVDLTRS